MDLPYNLQFEKVIDFFNKNEISPQCPICKTAEWNIMREAALIPQWSQNIPTPGIPIVAMICKKCGYLRMHAIGALNMLPTKEKEQDND